MEDKEDFSPGHMAKIQEMSRKNRTYGHPENSESNY